MDTQTTPNNELADSLSELYSAVTSEQEEPPVTLEQALNALLSRPFNPELYIRKLKDGGYVAGVERDPEERYLLATGKTIEEALGKLLERRAEEGV